MDSILHVIKDHWPIIAYFITLAGGLVGTFLFVSRVKVPNIERKLKAVEDKLDNLEKEQGNYVTTVHCGEIQDHCQTVNKIRFDQVCQKLDQIHRDQKSTERKRQEASIVFHSFIAAAKEKFDLKFTIPKIDNNE